MRGTRSRQWLLGGLLALAATACTTTFTEAELQAGEAKRDAQARSEEKRDVEIGAEGGQNLENIGEAEAWTVDETDL